MTTLEQPKRRKAPWCYGSVDAPMSAEGREEAEPPADMIHPND